MKIFLIVNFFILLNVFSVFCSGTSGGTILKYSPGVRQDALGGCGSALKGDFSSINFNPAILSTLRGFNISMLYNKLYLDTGIYYIAAGKSFDFIDAAFTITTYQGGNITINDIGDELDGQTFTAQSDYIFSLFVSKEILPGIYTALSPKLFYSTLIEKYSTSAIIMDWGIFYETNFFKIGRKRRTNKTYSDGLNIGLAIKNIGTKINYNKVSDTLPLLIRCGISYPVRFNIQHSIYTSFELLQSNEDNIRGGVGFEYKYDEMFFLRIGYKINYEIKNFTWGMGINYRMFKLDYSMLFNSAINNSHQVLLSFSM